MDLHDERERDVASDSLDEPDEDPVFPKRIELDAESFDAIVAMLDAPPVMPDGLRELMSRRPVWETLQQAGSELSSSFETTVEKSQAEEH